VVEPLPRAVEPPPRAPEVRPTEPLMPDFALDASTLSAPSLKAEPARAAPDSNTVDFNLEPLPPLNAPMNIDKVSSEPPAAVDFKLDLNDLDINAPAQRAGSAPTRDDHWYDVQQKFDLAKAYEEMGDKDGARDILQEVVREGDTEQQTQAKKLLGSLG
jgi:pilus assembly protein FimV